MGNEEQYRENIKKNSTVGKDREVKIKTSTTVRTMSRVNRGGAGACPAEFVEHA